ncbi:MAG: flavin reductase family protein [Candidatus Zipacnadales bacterium]
MQLSHDMLNHGVNIVTAQHEGVRGGLACAWATQVAIDQVLVCLGSQSATRQLILASRAFAVNVLAREHLPIARHFASGHSNQRDKFAGIAYHEGETGAPLLDDCALALDCVVKEILEAADHKLIIGRVVAVERNRDDYEPLIYRESDY